MNASRWPLREAGCTCVVPAAPFVPGMLHESGCALATRPGDRPTSDLLRAQDAPTVRVRGVEAMMAADNTTAEAIAVCVFCGHAMAAHAEPVETKIVGDELYVKCVLQPEGYARCVQQSVSIGMQNDNGGTS